MILFYNKLNLHSYILLLDKKLISLNFNEKFYFRGYSLNKDLILDNENFLISTNKLKLKY